MNVQSMSVNPGHVTSNHHCPTFYVAFIANVIVVIAMKDNFTPKK